MYCIPAKWLAIAIFFLPRFHLVAWRTRHTSCRFRYFGRRATKNLNNTLSDVFSRLRCAEHKSGHGWYGFTECLRVNGVCTAAKAQSGWCNGSRFVCAKYVGICSGKKAESTTDMHFYPFNALNGSCDAYKDHLFSGMQRYRQRLTVSCLFSRSRKLSCKRCSGIKYVSHITNDQCVVLYEENEYVFAWQHFNKNKIEKLKLNPHEARRTKCTE